MSSSIKIDCGISGFAEDKEWARRVRTNQLIPALDRGEAVTLDFADVSYTTQSFVHALIGEALGKFGEQALELLEFKRCSPQVRSVIELVVEYSFSGFPTPQQA